SGALVIRAEKVGSATVLANCSARSASTAFTCAHATHGRFSGRLFRDVGRRDCYHHRVCLGLLWSAAKLGLRLDQCRRGTHHCVPLCVGVGHTNVCHGRNRPRCHAGRIVSRCGGDRKSAQSRHAHRG